MMRHRPHFDSPVFNCPCGQHWTPLRSARLFEASAFALAALALPLSLLPGAAWAQTQTRQQSNPSIIDPAPRTQQPKARAPAPAATSTAPSLAIAPRRPSAVSAEPGASEERGATLTSPPLPQPDERTEFPLGEGEWVDVPPQPSIDLGKGSGRPLPSDDATGTGTGEQSAADEGLAGGDGAAQWILLAVLALAALGLVGFGVMRWRVQAKAPPRLENHVAKGTLKHIGDRRDTQNLKAAATPAAAPDAAPAAPHAAPPVSAASPPAASNPPQPQQQSPTAPASAPRPPAQPKPEPARLALSIAITGARRSVMMFTLDYRLTIANRADRAVRGLTLSGQLTCAQRGAANADPIARSQPIGLIDRIGPNQSAALAGTLQLPMVDVRMIRQGSVPVFIPLVHVMIEGVGQRAQTSSFVVGTPSVENQLRLHPIALDGPPGAISGLRADRIAQPFASEPA